MGKKNISRKGRSILLEILNAKEEPVSLIYYALITIAEKYKLTYAQLISIIANFREDIHKAGLDTPFKRHIEFEELDKFLEQNFKK